MAFDRASLAHLARTEPPMLWGAGIVAVALVLLIGACAPVTTYTDAEAPKRIKLDSSTAQIDVRFVPGSAALSPADAARLQHLAASGAIGLIRPDDGESMRGHRVEESA